MWAYNQTPGLDVLAHHGVKGQKWGVRRTPEQLGHRQSKTGRKPVKNDIYDGLPRLWYADRKTINGIVNKMSKKDRDLFFTGDSPWVAFRDAIPGKACIDVYYQSGQPANVCGISIAATKDARGKGYTDKLVKSAIKNTPDYVTDFTWKCAKSNTHSYDLALRNGFLLDKEKSNQDKKNYYLRYSR